MTDVYGLHFITNSIKVKFVYVGNLVPCFLSFRYHNSA